MEETIANLLEEKFQEDEFADCFIVGITHNNKRLEVFVDSDSGISFQKCQQLSRHLEAYLDEEKPLGDSYVLEVGSPGVTRPLKFWRQYPRNVGRKVEVTLRSKDKHTGTLVEVTPTTLVLEEKVRRKEGKRKVTELVRTELPYDEVAKTIVKVSI